VRVTIEGGQATFSVESILDHEVIAIDSQE
jgi:hypothetical protein